MPEITTKFASCFEDDTLERETITFKGKDDKELGRVTIRQLRNSESLSLLAQRPVFVEEKDFKKAKKAKVTTEEIIGWNAWVVQYLLKAIESWSFSRDGKPLEITVESIQSLHLEIITPLFDHAIKLNSAGEAEIKNSTRR